MKELEVAGVGLHTGRVGEGGAGVSSSGAVLISVSWTLGFGQCGLGEASLGSNSSL